VLRRLALGERGGVDRTGFNAFVMLESACQAGERASSLRAT
jgi:hypothetical protein